MMFSVLLESNENESVSGSASTSSAGAHTDSTAEVGDVRKRTSTNGELLQLYLTFMYSHICAL